MTRAAIGRMAALCLYAEEKENPETDHGRACNYGTGELRLLPGYYFWVDIAYSV